MTWHFNSISSPFERINHLVFILSAVHPSHIKLAFDCTFCCLMVVPMPIDAFAAVPVSPPTTVGTVFMFACAAVELLVNFASLPLSAFNFFLIATTSVLHPNIKHILLCQSGCILGRALCRLVICLLKFVLLDPMKSEQFQPIRSFYLFFLFGRNSLAHTLIIERVLATVLVKSYERRKKPYFSLGWLVIVLSLSLFYPIGYEEKGLSNVLTNAALLFTASIELAVFSALRLYSNKAYSQSKHSTNGHSLSERYQLSENVRIAKQLAPTLVLHLINILSATLITAWLFFELPALNYVLVSCAVFGSFNSALIEITMIMCHPFLKRNFANMLNCFSSALCWSSRVSASSPAAADNGSAAAALKGGGGAAKIATTNILNGETLVVEQGQEEHFEMLAKLWNTDSKSQFQVPKSN